jgi:hypothetical protein
MAQNSLFHHLFFTQLYPNNIRGQLMKIFVSILLIAIFGLSLTVGFDEAAMDMHDGAFNRAMISFGLAKGLNGIISLIQGTELSFTPVGVGLNFSVGEVLDPFNDMVERFSWVMLVASISLGVQKLLLVLSTKLFLQVGIGIGVVFSLMFIWVKQLQNSLFFPFFLKVLFLLFVLRFGAVLFVYSSEMFYNSVLKDEYISSSKVIEQTKKELQDMQNKNKEILSTKKQTQKKDPKWYEWKISSTYDNIRAKLDISKQLDSLQNSIEEASKKIITLITIFIVESIIMPLLFIWFFIVSIKFIFRVEIDTKMVYNSTKGE